MKTLVSSIFFTLITFLNISFGQEDEKQAAPDTVIVIEVDEMSTTDSVINEKTGIKPEPKTLIYEAPEMEAEFPGGPGL